MLAVSLTLLPRIIMRNLSRPLCASLLLAGLCATAAVAQNTGPLHPLDGLTTAEYWTAYDVLQLAGYAKPDTFFASVLLREPAKDLVLSWTEGKPIPREADVVLLQQGKTFEARVDLAARKLISWQEMMDVQAPFLASEIFGADEAIKKDPLVVEALKKRGFTDLNTVRCTALPVPYVAVPEQEAGRIGFGACSQQHGFYHSWGRSIEGLTLQMDMVTKKVLKVVDTEIVPVANGAVNYEELSEKPRPGTTPIAISQPMGASFQIKRGEVSWQNWHFRFRIDPRIGTVVNLVRFDDGGRLRPVMYEGSLSELYVPYMDPSNGWNNRVFMDAGEFYAGPGFLKPLRPGLDCPANASYFDGLSAGERGAPKLTPQLVCLFERTGNDPAWRHFENNTVYGRPGRELILRSAAAIGNYDYLTDWRFRQDGTIEVAVGATGVIETKAAAQKNATGHAMDQVGMNTMAEYGQFVADNTVGVNHDHFFSYRLDMDVDGPANSFMADRIVQKLLPSDPMRKSIWVVEHVIAAQEKDAIMDIHLERPSMWLFINPNVKGPLGYPTGYEIMAGTTAKSLLSADDPPQKLGAFSEHQFWVTPYDPAQRYAAGTYPTSSKGTDGLAVWTQANRPIENTDLVGWYTLGFHHMPRVEDWPVMPTMWHHFQIRPFNFFATNPALDLPKTQ
jgi:primary-amine oxidase